MSGSCVYVPGRMQVFSREELVEIAKLLEEFPDCLVLLDEVCTLTAPLTDSQTSESTTSMQG